MEEKKNRVTIKNVLMGMKVGDTVSYDIAKEGSISVSCSNLSLKYGVKMFEITRNRMTRTVTVKRIAEA